MRLLIGGSPSKFFHFEELGRALTRQGVECRVVLDRDVCNGFPSRSVPGWIRGSRRFKRLVREFDPDMILVDRQRHFARAASKSGIPLVIHLRGDIWKELEWANSTLHNSIPKKIALKTWAKIARETFEGSSLIIPICKHLDSVVRGKYPEKRTAVMYQGISPALWHAGGGMRLKHPCVGLLQGAVIWGKAKEMLILKDVLRSMPDVMFYWAGDGPYREMILRELEGYENFEWLGALEYPDLVREYLSEIDVYALITGIDMSPSTLQEAQLMKKPVVATGVGGVPEIMIHGKTGYVVKKGDPDGLVERLSLLINDEQKRAAMGDAGRVFVMENFGWDRVAKEFLDVLEKHLTEIKKSRLVRTTNHS